MALKRKIQLWRWVDEDGQPVPSIDGPRLHRWVRTQQAGNADLTYTDAFDYQMQLKPAAGANPHLVLFRIRDSDLPAERRNGQIVDLNPAVQELAEGSHFLLLPHNLVAHIGNGVSPRPGRLAEWVRNRMGWDVWLAPVLREDLATAMADIERVSSVELAISQQEVRRLDLNGFFEPDDPLGPLKAAAEFGQGGIVRVGWSVGLGGHHDPGFFRSLFERLVRADVSSFRVAKAQVRTEGGDSVPVDFVHDKVVREVEVDDRAGRQRTLPEGVAAQLLNDSWQAFTDEPHLLENLDPVADGTLEWPQALIDPIDHV